MRGSRVPLCEGAAGLGAEVFGFEVLATDFPPGLALGPKAHGTN
jgi:hypothetical protein